MASENDAASRGADAARRAAELRHRHDELTAGQPVTAEDVEQAERRAEEARIAAAHAARSAASSLEESARLHDRVAHVEEQTVQRAGASGTRAKSTAFHRESAETDRILADQKRREADANDS